MHGQPGCEQPRRVGHDLDFAGVAGRDGDLAGTSYARQPWAHDVERVVVQIGGGHRACEIQDVHRKRGGSEPLDDEIGACRENLPRVVDLPLHLLQGDDHVGCGLELGGDFSRAAECRRTHAANARYLHHRLLERPRYRQHHRLRRQRAAVTDDDDTREFQAG